MGKSVPGNITKDAEFFKLLANSTYDIITLLGKDGTILFENEAAHNMLGYRVGEQTGKDVFDFIHPDDQPEIRKQFQQLLRNPDHSLSVECRVADAKGNWVWIEAMGQNMLSNEILNGILIHSRDISLRKERELDLKKLNERIESSFCTGKNAWWEMMLPSGEVIFHENKSRMLGYNKDKFRHYSDFMNCVHPDDNDHLMQAIRDHLEGHTDIYKCTYRIRHKNGDYIWLQDIGKIISRKGERVVIRGIVSDLSEYKREELALIEREKKYRELNAGKDKFFNILSHDLKSPINAVMGFSDLMMRHINEGRYKKVAEHAAIIRNSARQQLNLLNNLLQWSSMQSGKIPFQPEPLELKEVGKEILNFISANAFEKHISFYIDIPAGLKVYADRNMLETILRNLSSNAIKYTSEGGWVRLSATEEENEVLLEIEDNGEGISEEDIHKLFKLESGFSRPGTNQETGTGLGLIICKEFVERHGGKIRVESRKNEGSKFSFNLQKNG